MPWPSRGWPVTPFAGCHRATWAGCTARLPVVYLLAMIKLVGLTPHPRSGGNPSWLGQRAFAHTAMSPPDRRRLYQACGSLTSGCNHL